MSLEKREGEETLRIFCGTKNICACCKGKGCKRCNRTGKILTVKKKEKRG